MATNKTDIYVYAHWQGMPKPAVIGILSAHLAKGRKAFRINRAKNGIISVSPRCQHSYFTSYCCQ